MRVNGFAVVAAVMLLLFSTGASAQLEFYDTATNDGVLDKVIAEFATKAAGWRSIVMNAATSLFWTLGTISLVWTGGMMALRKADIGEFFSEFIRFILFFGFFLWLLRNGPEMADAIIKSLRQLGERSVGTTGVSPSGIVDVGFMILKQAKTHITAWQPVDSFVSVTLSIGILIVLTVIAVNMLLMLVSGWILMYAGVFFLGFGGSRWTSDMAINYFKTVLGVAAQLFVMVLIVGIGSDMLTSFYAKMSKGALNFEELGVMIVFCVALLLLVDRIPALVAGIITGAGVGGAGIGQIGAGTVIGAAMAGASIAASAAGMAGAAMKSGAANVAGGVSALKAAFEKAQGGTSSAAGPGMNLMASLGDVGTSNGQRSGSPGPSPFAKAAGFGSSTGGGATRAAGKAATGGRTSGSNGSDMGGNTSFGRGTSSSTVPKGTPSGLLASTASAIGTAGRLATDMGANLAKGTGDVVKGKVSDFAGAVADRIAETAGGRIAAAIRGSGAGDEFHGDSLSGAASMDAEASGGQSESWIDQTGGLSGLSSADEQTARESHSAWQSADPKRHTFGIDDYVSYAQGRQQERKSEVASFVNGTQPSWSG